MLANIIISWCFFRAWRLLRSRLRNLNCTFDCPTTSQCLWPGIQKFRCGKCQPIVRDHNSQCAAGLDGSYNTLLCPIVNRGTFMGRFLAVTSGDAFRARVPSINTFISSQSLHFHDWLAIQKQTQLRTRFYSLFLSRHPRISDKTRSLRSIKYIHRATRMIYGDRSARKTMHN